MFSSRGFTLVEAIVAALVGVILVVAVGRVGQSVIHQRSSTDSNSAATSLAEWQMEKLLADPVQKPELDGLCSGGSVPALCGAAPTSTGGGRNHGPIDVNEKGTTIGTLSYRVQWNVVNLNDTANSPLVTPTGASMPMKKITVTVTHLRNSSARASVVRYHRPV
jgi:competence protein ComGC